MIELERTYLAKSIPDDLKNCKSEEIIDTYIPREIDHPRLRLRKKGNRYTLTKKVALDKDPSKHEEHEIVLTDIEYNALRKIGGKEIRKVRYHYPYKNMIAEIDIFKGDLKGLVSVDFEFNSVEEKDSFRMPDFCLANVTNEKSIAGFTLCGKSYNEIKNTLDKYNYSKLST
ncbi:MAG: adenylate cyclase [Candidatus Woesearchaeota archaeon]|nr:MAG: adenylate cyclase [Candidatus Woesearchaeota archaeon]